MAKRNKFIYWVATAWLCLGMVSTGIVQTIKLEQEVAMMTHLGYPVYLLTMLGICKILGVIAILIPKYPILKEWAYAGFFFNMTGAIISHIFLSDSIDKILPSLLLLLLTMLSWYFKPSNK